MTDRIHRSIPQRSRLRCRDKSIALDAGPVIVGILNITEESFFDGGRYRSVEAALEQADRMVAEGAGLIDIGGQSTRPGFQELSVEDEIARVVPPISALSGRLAVPISIDTYKPAVAAAALEAGAHIVNDVHGLHRFPEMALVAARHGAAVIAMHQAPDFKEVPGDPLEKLFRYFERSHAIARGAGIGDDQLALDPGIGFAKSHEQNLEIISRIEELRALGFPLLLGASRKSVIGNVLGLPPADRLEGTLATTALAVWAGVEFIRVHDVAANARAAKMTAALRAYRRP